MRRTVPPGADFREWDGPAVLPPCERACLCGAAEGAPAMPKSNAAVVTIGIDPGKNTLHLV
jgi:hypothetical protein